MNASPPQVPSPCIGVCRLDERQVCVGCWRSLDEIVQWPGASAQRKLAIIAAARQRAPATGEPPPS